MRGISVNVCVAANCTGDAREAQQFADIAQLPLDFACMKRLLVALILFVSAPTFAQVTTPAQYLGRPLGGDFTLADYSEVSGYYRKLAEQLPARVRVSVEGKTTEGRDFVFAVISSEANISNLEQIKQHAHTIADPRGKSSDEKERALRDGKVTLFITPQMHSDEAAGTQMLMEFAHLLATSDDEPWKSARDNVVVVLAACQNPDGLDQVVNWYRKNLNTPYEAARMTELYQRYTGHDNNRDWFMFSQVETQITSRMIYKEWLPQILWDVHQQGQKNERLFVPPYRDPLNPNLDPSIVAGINLIGTRAVMDMTRDNMTGVATGSTFDMWWHGGNRTTPVRHNMIAILTEAASCNLGSPIFIERADLKSPNAGDEYGPSNDFLSPWPGGWWRIRNIIDYELAFGRSLLATINREPRTWRENTMRAAERAIDPKREGVKSWIIPSNNRDPSAVKRLVDALLQAGIELHVAPNDINADGRTYPAGSIVIRRDQPWSAHVKDLFDIHRYPDKKPPYDVAGWTLPLLMGVQRVEVMSALDDATMKALKPIAKADDAVATFNVKDVGMSDSSFWTWIATRLKNGQEVTIGKSKLKKMPRIGIYAPWSANMDEGWLRWCFDTWKIPYVSVRNEAIRAGKLSDFLDVLIIADATPNALEKGRAFGSVPEEFARGLAPEGSAAIEEFVRGGGTLITFKSASKWTIELLQAPLVEVTPPVREPSTTQPATQPSEDRFSCPGSVLRGIPQNHILTSALPESVPLFFANALAWRENTRASERAERSERAAAPEKRVEVLMRYAPTELLLSGYINRPQTIEGQIAWARVEYGKGRAHLFAFQPQYRGWTQATIPLIFRAALLEETAQPAEPR